MATHTRILVLAADDKGATSTFDSAQLALVAEADLGTSAWPHTGLATTHSFSGGHYAPDAPTNDPESGKFLLVVRGKGKAPVVQKLTFKKTGDVVHASGGWGPTGPKETAATVAIANYDDVKKVDDQEQAKVGLITVTLHPAQFFVSLACVSPPHDGADYQLFGYGRFGFLFDQKRLHAGAVARLFNAPKRVLEIRVKSRDKALDSTVLVGKIERTTDEPRMSIVDLYGALNEIGTSDPGTVVESAVWGHAWHAGPIVFNTGDSMEQQLPRDPNDTDGRPKDFHAQGTLATSFPKAKDAFTKDGAFRVGGCSHMTNVVAEATTANEKRDAGTARDAFYEVPMPGGWLLTSLDYSKRSIAQYVQAKDFARFAEQGESAGFCTYLGRAAQMLSTPVFGAPPGCEGNQGFIRASNGTSLRTMKIIDVIYTNPDGTQGGAENKRLTKYYKAEFGEAFVRDELNYLHYQKMLTAPLPELGFDTRRSLVINASKTLRKLRLATGFHVARPLSATFERPIPHSETSAQGHLFVAKKAAVGDMRLISYPDGVQIQILVLNHIVDEKPVTDDLGFFVTSAGKVLLRRRVAGSKDFAPHSAELPVFELLSDWVETGKKPASEVLHEVTPKWVW